MPDGPLRIDSDKLPTKVVVHIEYDTASMQCLVEGPVQNPMLIYGVLEAAKESILAFRLARMKGGPAAIDIGQRGQVFRG